MKYFLTNTLIIIFLMQSLVYSNNDRVINFKDKELDERIDYVKKNKQILYFAYLINEPGVTERLSLNYKGIQDVKKLDELLEKQEYIEVLFHLYTEKDAKKRINWLEEKALLGHPILMLELGKEYIVDSPTLETYFYKALPWFKAGLMCTEIDYKCTRDEYKKQMMDPSTHLMLTYDLIGRLVFSQKECMDSDEKALSGEKICAQIEEFSKLHDKEVKLELKKIVVDVIKPLLSEPTSMMRPSPCWLCPSSKPVENFEEIRKAEAKEILSLFEK